MSGPDSRADSGRTGPDSVRFPGLGGRTERYPLKGVVESALSGPSGGSFKSIIPWPVGSFRPGWPSGGTRIATHRALQEF